jgi:KAP family P-loop domain
MSEAGAAFRSDKLRNIDSDSSDAFGHRDYANTVIAALEDFPEQFTLGLFGAWGTGKSTILKEVGRQLRDESETKAAFVLFDAWRYEGDSLRREFIRTVGMSLDRQAALRESFDFDKHVETFDTDTTTTARPRLGFDAGALRDGAIAAALVAAAVVALIFVLPKLGLSRPTTLKMLIATSSALTAFVLFALQRVVAADPVQATQRRLEFPDQFASNFRELLDNVSTTRLVIAIDNLDRCSPARVTEILSSVKTFLEPAFDEEVGEGRGYSRWERVKRWLAGDGAGKENRSLAQMCFIIAADDAALRRHLTAQEVGKNSVGNGGEPALPAEVRTSVDEYLRKFFGASLRIREVLDEDIQQFTTEELGDFIEARKLDEDLASALIAITSQGLKRNPRRIKQFVNNLQLRLRMLAERRAQERIQIDPDVRVVAKLAILEEEFPDEFEELQADPRLLVNWHAEARTSTGSSSEPNTAALDPALASFLRFTDDIQPRDIRAYLNLKQSKVELELPRYGEFVDLLDDGDVDKLRALLAEEEGEERKYTKAARWHFDAERRARAWGRAYNTLRSIVEVPLLHGEEGRTVRLVLEEALRQQVLEERLNQLEPNALLDAAILAELPKPKLQRLINSLVTGMGVDQSSETRRGVATALAAHTDQIDDVACNQIRETLAAEGVRADFDSYAVFAETLPEVLDGEALDAALARIEEMGAEGVATSNGAFRVAAAMLRRQPEGPALERFLQLVNAALNNYRDTDSEEFGAVARELMTIVEGAEETPAMSELAGEVAAQWETIPAGSRMDALALGLLLCDRSPLADSQAGAGLAERLFGLEDGATIVRFLGKALQRPPEQFRVRADGLTINLLAGERGNLSKPQIADLLTLYDDETRVRLTREAAMLAVSLERGEVADGLMRGLDEAEQEELLEKLLSRVIEEPASRLLEAQFIVARRLRIDEERIFEFGMRLARLAYEDRGIVTQVAPLISGLEFAHAGHRLQLVQDLIATEEDMTDRENREAVLRAAWDIAGRRSSKARETIVGRLEQIRDSEQDEVRSLATTLLDSSK